MNTLSETTSTASQKQHFQAILQVGKYLQKNGPIVPTQDIVKVYCQSKGLTTPLTSSSMYDALCKHLNINQVYIRGKGYIIPNTARE